MDSSHLPRAPSRVSSPVWSSHRRRELASSPRRPPVFARRAWIMCLMLPTGACLCDARFEACARDTSLVWASHRGTSSNCALSLTIVRFLIITPGGRLLCSPSLRSRCGVCDRSRGAVSAVRYRRSRRANAALVTSHAQSAPSYASRTDDGAATRGGLTHPTSEWPAIGAQVYGRRIALHSHTCPRNAAGACDHVCETCRCTDCGCSIAYAFDL